MTAIVEAVARIRAWGEARSWCGYDPYDALNSPFASALTMRTRTGARLLTQVVKVSPLNLRPLLRIEPAWNAKAIGLVASGYARLAAAQEDASARNAATHWLEWLVERPANGGAGWGYHFDVRTRVFAYRRGAPNTIATTFVGQALLDGVELLEEARFAEPAAATAQFLLDRMWVRRGERPWFRYLPAEDELVHNANLLACALLVRTARITNAPSLLEPAAEAVATTLAAQRRDGAFPYAEGARHDWVDNFHTGYVLESLAECARALPGLEEPLARGVAHWREAFFLRDGTPKYFANRLYPIDAHCYAQAVETSTAVGDLDHARATALLLVERMLDPAGYIHFQRRRLWTSRVPLIRWTTGPSFRALAGLLLAERRCLPKVGGLDEGLD